MMASVIHAQHVKENHESILLQLPTPLTWLAEYKKTFTQSIILSSLYK